MLVFCFQNLKFILEKTVSQVSILTAEVQTLRDGVQDLSRLYTKYCIRVDGKALGQDCRDVDAFIQAVWLKWKVDLKPLKCQLLEFHPVQGGHVVKFSSRGEGSAYQQLMVRPGNWEGDPKVDLRVMAMCKGEDQLIRIVLQRLKREKVCYHVVFTGFGLNMISLIL